MVRAVAPSAVSALTAGAFLAVEGRLTAPGRRPAAGRCGFTSQPFNWIASAREKNQVGGASCRGVASR